MTGGVNKTYIIRPHGDQLSAACGFFGRLPEESSASLDSREDPFIPVEIDICGFYL